MNLLQYVQDLWKTLCLMITQNPYYFRFTVHIWLYFIINLESSSSLKRSKQGHLLRKCNIRLGLNHLNCFFTEALQESLHLSVFVHFLPAQEQKTSWTLGSQGSVSYHRPLKMQQRWSALQPEELKGRWEELRAFFPRDVPLCWESCVVQCSFRQPTHTKALFYSLTPLLGQGQTSWQAEEQFGPGQNCRMLKS